MSGRTQIPISKKVIQKFNENYWPDKFIIHNTNELVIDNVYNSYMKTTPSYTTDQILVNPVVYDDSSEIDNVKISDKFPMFKYGNFIDEILDEYGGVIEILKCEWNMIHGFGEVVCLLKNWKVCRFVLTDIDGGLSKQLLEKNHEVYDDIEDYEHFVDVNGGRKQEVTVKKQVKPVSKIDEEYLEKMKTATQNLFAGNIAEIQKLMADSVVAKKQLK